MLSLRYLNEIWKDAFRIKTSKALHTISSYSLGKAYCRRFSIGDTQRQGGVQLRPVQLQRQVAKVPQAPH